jgi:signal transduction histidine kinase
MKVHLASRDTDLYKLCREILAELLEQEWDLCMSGAEDPEADLTIWDYSAELEIPQAVGCASCKHLFLVHRNDIAAFREAVDFAEASILLKPVTNGALAAFLQQAVSAHEKRASTANALRADRDELLQRLIEANLKLQEYDQDRTNFLARGVHDFRAPLTAISGYCGLLLSEALGSLTAEQKEVLRRMQHSTKRLSRMSSAMFQLSARQYIRRRPEFRKQDLQECLDQVLHEIGMVAEAKNISVSTEMEAESRLLHCEEGQIEQLLINLLDNACKFTPKNGVIEIRGYAYFWDRRAPSSLPVADNERRRRVNREPNAYRIDVRNSGAPIPQKHLRSIFEEYTSYTGRQDRSGGGLGLAICRMIATQHEGTIWAENTENGPMFSVLLPFHLRPAAQFSEQDPRQLTRYAEVI